jgi:hypothetical protein
MINLLYTIFILICRYIVLNSNIYNYINNYSNGIINGYFLIIILFYLLNIRLSLIIIFLIGRIIYRYFFYENTLNIYDPLTNIIFCLGVYICLEYNSK